MHTCTHLYEPTFVHLLPFIMTSHKRRPRRPWALRVQSVGIGVTSSMRPIFMPARANARNALCAPGPGVLVLVPPVALNLTCKAVMPNSLQRAATSWAASMAAYGEDSSRSALTFMPPVTRTRVSRPEMSVTWTNVSLNDAKTCATPKTISPSRTCGPKDTASTGAFALGAMFTGGGLDVTGKLTHALGPK